MAESSANKVQRQAATGGNPFRKLEAAVSRLSDEDARRIGLSYAERKKFQRDLFGGWGSCLDTYLKALITKKLYGETSK